MSEHMQPPLEREVFLTQHRVSRAQRVARYGHLGGVLWLTGLPGSGKSTRAMELERTLFDAGYSAYVLDGDNVRHGLSSDLGFSATDRAENIHRVGKVAALMADAGLVCMTAFISPFASGRARAREAARQAPFYEVYLLAGLAVCESRDSKGLYRKARAGANPEFTGISSPHDPLTTPDLVLRIGEETISESLGRHVEFVRHRFAASR